jgi:hypothetical protein
MMNNKKKKANGLHVTAKIYENIYRDKELKLPRENAGNAFTPEF